MSVRFIALSSLLFLAACATPTQVQMAPGFLGSESAAPATATASGSATATEAAPLPKSDDKIGNSYTIAKVGAFLPAGDLDDLDDGIYFEGIFGRELLAFLAVEGQIGYLTTDGQFGGSTFDIWALPLFVNARASVPILIFEPYVGVGLGGIYADYEAGSSSSSSDFVLAYQGFVGLEAGIGSLAVGAEYKYLLSEDTSDNFAIEGGMASLFVSIPF